MTTAEVVAEGKPKRPQGGIACRRARQWHAANAAGKRAAPPAREPRRPLLEIILDPRTIQWLLGLGGVLLVVGLVIWLAAVGVFENPVVVAVTLGRRQPGGAGRAAGRRSASRAIRPSAGSSRCWPAW